MWLANTNPLAWCPRELSWQEMCSTEAKARQTLNIACVSIRWHLTKPLIAPHKSAINRACCKQHQISLVVIINHQRRSAIQLVSADNHVLRTSFLGKCNANMPCCKDTQWICLLGASIFSHLNVYPCVCLNETALHFHLHFTTPFSDINSIYYRGVGTLSVSDWAQPLIGDSTVNYICSLIFQLWIKVRLSSV